MNNKRILIYSQAFFPDHSGIPIYSSDFAFYCAENGYDVDVITGFSFYPHWQKRKEDRRRFFGKEFVKNISIYRGYLYVTPHPSSLQRIIHEVTLFISAFFNSLRVKKPDVVVVFTTPILLGVLGAIMNLFWRSTLVINIQDFQVEAAQSLGMLNRSPLLRIFEKLEKWSYKRANFVTSITHSMTDLLINRKKVSKHKVLYWPNWLQDELGTNALHVKGNFRRKFNIPFEIQFIGYAGNVGKKQGLRVLIDVAKSFIDDKHILFLIIGEGSDLESLKAYVQLKNAHNIRFIPFLDKNDYVDFLTDADAIFISQVDVPFDIYFPSKLLSIMAMRQLLIVNASSSSELYKTLIVNELAMVSEYGNIDKLKQDINLVISKCSTIEKYKLRSGEFVKQFERTTVIVDALKSINV